MKKKTAKRQTATKTGAPKSAKRKRLPIAVATKMGRPSKYEERFIEMMDDHFKYQELIAMPLRTGEVKYRVENFPTLEGFALKIGVHVETIHRWARETEADGKTLHYPDFSNAYARARASQNDLVIRAGMLGALNPVMASLAAKNLCGWKDKIESVEKVEHTFTATAELDRIYAEGQKRKDALNAKVGRGPLAVTASVVADDED